MRWAAGGGAAWLCCLCTALAVVAWAPTLSPEAPKLLVVVECADSTPVFELVEVNPALVSDGCVRHLLAHVKSADLTWSAREGDADVLAEGGSTLLAPTVRPGWPRSFPRFVAQTLATADLGDPRGRATLLNEDTGFTHALAPDGTPVAGWPILLPQLLTSFMPASMNVDEQGPEEILLGSIEVHLLSHEGVEWPSWPFRVPGTGFGNSPIATRLVDEEPVRIVTATGRSLLFVLDQEAVPLPGWPVQAPKGVFPVTGLGSLAVGDISGDAVPEIVANIVNENRVDAYDLAGRLVPGFPVQRSGQAQEPSLADLDGDGRLEILAWSNAGPSVPGVIAVRGNGHMLTGWPRASQSGTGNDGVAVGDVDGDEDLEVLASTVNGGEAGAGGVYLWHHDGTPVIGWPKFFPNISFPNPVVIADVDGDGIGDPVVAGFSVVSPTNGLIYAWKGSGELIPGFPIVIPFRPVGFGSPTIDDLDGDGVADLGITTQQALTILFPGRVHWFDLGVPYRAEGMEWPTRSHDMARTAAYRPPVRRVPMEVQIAPPQINTRTPAPPLTVILRTAPEETARPRTLRLRFVNGARVPELDGQFLEDDGETVVFRLDGGAVRALLGPGEHTLGFWTEAVGGLGGVLYQGEAALTLRPMPVRPALPSSRDRGLRSPRIEAPAPVAPAPVRTINPTG